MSLTKDEVTQILGSYYLTDFDIPESNILDAIAGQDNLLEETEIANTENKMLNIVSFASNTGGEWPKYVSLVFGFKEHPDQYWSVKGFYNGEENQWDSRVTPVKPVIVPRIEYEAF